MSRPLTVVFLFVALSGCRGPGEPSSGDQEGNPYLRCAPPADDGIKESFKLAPLTIERDGYEMEIRGIERGVVILGLISGINEPNGATVANIGYFLDRFKAAGAQAVVVAGGVGLTAREVEQNLAALAAAPVPVLISPGAQESFDVLRQAILSLRKRYRQLIDLTLVRRVRLGHVSLISLPGYHNAFYLEAKERGCAYEPGDLADVVALAKGERCAVLVSASPPRGIGARAVDRGRGGVNIGDPALARELDAAGIRFGLFGHVYEAGGQATLADGSSPVAAGVWSDALFVQAGAADAVPLSLVSGGRSVGMAQIVEFSGPRGRYRTIMAQPIKR
jgi:hypothetical protein